MLTETIGATAATNLIANSNGTCADQLERRNTEAVARGIDAAEIGLDAIVQAFHRNVDGIRNQLAELRRSIDSGKPTDFVVRFGLARQIAASGVRMPELADKLANDIIYDDSYYAHGLELTLWPLLSLAAGIEDDAGYELQSLIRMWCHGGAIELEEETERAMFDAAGLLYTPAESSRCLPDVTVGPVVPLQAADDEEERRAG